MGTERMMPERTPQDAEAEIRAECEALANFLAEKNRRYGDSALNPVRIFSRADAVEQIRVRIDDKLSRLPRGDGSASEDAVLDLLGYLVLLRVAEKRAAPARTGGALTLAEFRAFCDAPRGPVTVGGDLRDLAAREAMPAAPAAPTPPAGFPANPYEGQVCPCAEGSK